MTTEEASKLSQPNDMKGDNDARDKKQVNLIVELQVPT